MTVIDLARHQKPVRYTIDVTQHFDGTVEAFIHDVSDDPRSLDSVTEALRRVVEARLNARVGAAGDAMLAIMLANIDHAMNCTDASPALFRVTPQELSAWAEAVQEYETARFPEVSHES